MNTHIYLIRHGTSVGNKENIFQGQLDFELDQMGEKQAEVLANYLHDSQQTFSKIYSSPLKRASKTAHIIADKLEIPVAHLPHLVERHFGEWQGIKIDQIQETYTDWMALLNKGGAFGIESLEDQQNRMINELEIIARKNAGEHLLVVTHGLAICSVLEKLTKGKYSFGKGTHLDNTSITHLVYKEMIGCMEI